MPTRIPPTREPSRQLCTPFAGTRIKLGFVLQRRRHRISGKCPPFETQGDSMNEKPDKPPWSPRLDLWLRKSWNEAGSSGDPSDYSRDFAILPTRLFELIGSLNKEQKNDFWFIGSFAIRPAVAEAREWIIPFVRRAFGSRSFLQFTDSVTRQNHRPYGPYDHTNTRTGFVPREMPLSQRGHLDPD